jgi:putative ABC transport system permease protein
VVSTTRTGRSLWWRWSWRDLRGHWVAVVSIAFVIALGTGVYAGLGSTAAWRYQSNDASFAALRMHDVRAQLSPGTFTPQGSLAAAVANLPSADDVSAVTERLIVESQVDASTADDTILVTARLVGSPFGEPGTVSDLWVAEGTFTGTDPPAVVLEKKFADFYSLPPTGTVTIAGGVDVDYSGLGVAPEDFFVFGVEGSLLAQADFATMYGDLSVVQQLAGRPGDVNDVVLTVSDEATRDRVENDLREALDALPGVSATVTNQDQDETFRILYDDIENDQRIWNALSALVLFAAALAAFNLISRIVEAQRRQIGIGMALGLPRWRLAIRPVLVGLQVGVLGTLLGVGVGVVLGNLMRGLLESFLPLPDYRTPFQFDVFARGAVFGLVPPVLASLIAVWRAVRVEPIQAIRTGHLAATGGRVGSWSSKLRLPGSSLAQMPVRNLLRAPRRTVLTALGVAAAITALVAVLGMLDSFTRAIDRGAAEVTKGDPERVTVSLDTFYSVTSPEVTAIVDTPSVATADPTLRLPAAIRTAGNEPFDVLLEILDFDAAQWTPTIVTEVEAGSAVGLVVARKAADDLGVSTGDTVLLRHPQADAAGFSMVETEMVVAAIHPNPMRTFAFLDDRFAVDFGLAGITNGLQTTPVAGALRDDIQREVFDLAGVASAQPVARVGETFDQAMEEFVGFLYITAGAMLLLALLIAFNSTRIAVEERRREHATMLAFGVRVRSVMGVVTRESIVIGMLATLVGIAAGMLAVQLILRSIAEQTLPDFGIELYLSPATLVIAAAVGIVAVAIAPVFLVRKVKRMDLPSTLRVME